MKNIVIKLLIIIGLLFVPYNVFASGGVSLSTNKLNITKGNTSSFKVTASNAAGNIIVSSSNPNVANVSLSSLWIENETVTVNVVGKSVGNATITITLNDMATFDEAVLSGTYKVEVEVKEKTVYIPPVDNRSNNTNISSLKVNGLTPTVKDNMYVLEVGNSVEEADILATVEDSKSSITGIGKKNLEVGDNKFDIVVTAENETRAVYQLIVTKRKYNTLSEIDELLNLNKDIEITFSENDEITKDILDKIIEKKTKVILNKVSSDDSILYSWVLDGNVITSDSSFNPNIIEMIDSNDKMENAFNFADGIYLDFTNCLNIPDGAVLKYFVGDKYSDNEDTNLYSYDETSDEVTQLESNVRSQSGYIELSVSDTSKYFVSKTNVISNNITNKDNNNINFWFYISIIQLLIIIGGIVSFCIYYKKNKKSVI